MGKGKKRPFKEDSEREFDPAPKHLSIAHIKNQEKRLIVVLEQAQLESVKVSTIRIGPSLLNKHGIGLWIVLILSI